MLISIETHITCDFPGGPDPLSPLWVLSWSRLWLVYVGGGFSRFSLYNPANYVKVSKWIMI